MAHLQTAQEIGEFTFTVPAAGPIGIRFMLSLRAVVQGPEVHAGYVILKASWHCEEASLSQALELMFGDPKSWISFQQRNNQLLADMILVHVDAIAQQAADAALETWKQQEQDP